MHMGNFSSKVDENRRSSILFAYRFMVIDQRKSAFPLKEC